MASDSRKVADYLSHSIDPTTKVPSIYLVTADNVGVEVELENMNPALDYSRLRYWRATTDGSLRDNGIEFVFRQPMGGVDVLNAVQELEEFIVKNKVRVQLSERTSVHVHLDVRDLSVDEMFNLIVAYAFVERVMMRYCGEERMKNNFCIPLYDIGSTTFLHRISSMKNLGTFQHAANGFTENERYSAFNLNALLGYGSIEFRGYHGAYASGELLNWINVILSLKKFARDTPPEFCREFHTNISKLGIDHIFSMIFRPDIARYLQSSYTREDLVACIPVVQDLIILSDVINEAEKQLKNSKPNDNPLIKRLMYVHNKPLYYELYGTVADKDGKTEAVKPKKSSDISSMTTEDLLRMREAIDRVNIQAGAVVNPFANIEAIIPTTAEQPRRTTTRRIGDERWVVGGVAPDAPALAPEVPPLPEEGHAVRRPVPPIPRPRQRRPE